LFNINAPAASPQPPSCQTPAAPAQHKQQAYERNLISISGENPSHRKKVAAFSSNYMSMQHPHLLTGHTSHRDVLAARWSYAVESGQRSMQSTPTLPAPHHSTRHRPHGHLHHHRPQAVEHCPHAEQTNALARNSRRNIMHVHFSPTQPPRLANKHTSCTMYQGHTAAKTHIVNTVSSGIQPHDTHTHT